MKKYLGGYANVDLASDTIYNDLLNLKNVDKTILLYDPNETKPYFIDTIVYDTDSIIITKGGKTITITDVNSVTSTGIVSAPTMENIVDLNGNKRFVDFDYEGEEITGVNYEYTKWSLSGTHFMIVCAGNIDNGTTLTSGDTLVDIELPDYINNKIYPIIEGSQRINSLTFPLLAADGTTQNINGYLLKTDEGLKIQVSSVTLTALRGFRIQFDLLIDAE